MAKERLANEIHIITRVIGFLIVSLKQSIDSMRNTLNYDYFAWNQYSAFWAFFSKILVYML